MKAKNQNVVRLAYSVQEAAVAIGVSSRTLHDFIKSGTIAHFRMGTRVLIPTDALRDFLAARMKSGRGNHGEA